VEIEKLINTEWISNLLVVTSKTGAEFRLSTKPANG
jgi:hypothetical protein